MRKGRTNVYVGKSFYIGRLRITISNRGISFGINRRKKKRKQKKALI